MSLTGWISMRLVQWLVGFCYFVFIPVLAGDVIDIIFVSAVSTGMVFVSTMTPQVFKRIRRNLFGKVVISILWVLLGSWTVILYLFPVMDYFMFVLVVGMMLIIDFTFWKPSNK
jgi:hypothetical protein